MITRADVGRIYEQARQHEAARSGAVSEEGLQTAAVYFLARMRSHRRLTVSLFLERARQRDKDVAKGTAFQPAPVGSAADLAFVEDTVRRERGGRKPAKKHAE